MNWWKELDARAQRKAIILVTLILAGLLILIWPSGASPWRSRTRPQPGKSSPAGRPAAVGRAGGPSNSQPVAANPLAKLLGKWEGRESLPNRGMCNLSLEVRPGGDGQSFSAFSTLGCIGTFLPKSGDYNKDPAGFTENMRQGLNPTSASFSGTAGEGGITLRALDNIGVSEALQGCEMVAMSLRNFGDNRMSVKWQESGKGLCTGGEMLLTHAH